MDKQNQPFGIWEKWICKNRWYTKPAPLLLPLLPVPEVRICADGRGRQRHGVHERMPGGLAAAEGEDSDGEF